VADIDAPADHFAVDQLLTVDINPIWLKSR